MKVLNSKFQNPNSNGARLCQRETFFHGIFVGTWNLELGIFSA